MLRLILAATAFAALFAGAVWFGGDALGAWEGYQKPAEKRVAEVSRSEARWIGGVNQLCRQARRDLDRLKRELPAPSTRAEAIGYVRQMGRLNARYNDRFRELRAPRRFAREYRNVLELFSRDERLMAGMLRALRIGNVGRIEELTRRLASLAAAERRALADIGAVACVVGASAEPAV